jgi:hypothetical protein
MIQNKILVGPDKDELDGCSMEAWEIKWIVPSEQGDRVYLTRWVPDDVYEDLSRFFGRTKDGEPILFDSQRLDDKLLEKIKTLQDKERGGENEDSEN